MHRLTATDTPMVRYTRTIFPSYAFDKTCRKRETLSVLEHYEEILCSISEDSTLQNLWKNYCRKYKYASHIEFSTNLEIIKQLMSQMLEIE